MKNKTNKKGTHTINTINTPIKKNIYEKVNTLFLWIVFLFCTVVAWASAFALEVVTPSAGGQADVNITHTVIDWNEDHVIELIKTINWYLWFFVGLVAFILVVYSWFNMITAWGDKETIKKSYHILIAALASIVIALLSYTMVRLVVNLF